MNSTRLNKLKSVAAGIGVIVVMVFWGFAIAHDGQDATSRAPAQVVQLPD